MPELCKDAMSVSEIGAFYRRAKDKNEALEILAQCNATDAGTIMEILKQEGVITGLPSQKLPEKVQQLIELADKGCTLKEASEQSGICYKTASSYASRYGIRFERSKASPSKGSGQGSTRPIKEKLQKKQKKQLEGKSAKSFDMVDALQVLLAEAENIVGIGAVEECGAKPGEAVLLLRIDGNRYRLRLERMETKR